jgi:hypothetical protein
MEHNDGQDNTLKYGSDLILKGQSVNQIEQRQTN